MTDNYISFLIDPITNDGVLYREVRNAAPSTYPGRRLLRGTDVKGNVITAAGTHCVRAKAVVDGEKTYFVMDDVLTPEQRKRWAGRDIEVPVVVHVSDLEEKFSTGRYAVISRAATGYSSGMHVRVIDELATVGPLKVLHVRGTLEYP